MNVRCLPAHDEADQIVGLMLAQVLQRRGFTVSIPDTVSLASEMVSSMEAQMADVLVVSALPPKAALHARYLTKLVRSRHADLHVIVGLWTNDKGNAIKFEKMATATTLDGVQDRIDQMTPAILLGRAAAPAPSTHVSAEPLAPRGDGGVYTSPPP